MLPVSKGIHQPLEEWLYELIIPVEMYVGVIPRGGGNVGRWTGGWKGG